MSGPTSSPGDRLLASAQAPAKLILLGEHFVVHGAPALALPLPLFCTRVDVSADPALDHTTLDTGEAPPDATALRVLDQALELLTPGRRPPWRVAVRATIPIGHGLGSSASFAVALLRALAAAAGRELPVAALNEHAHALETITHGTPSGIDDTVVTLGVPIWFRRGGAVTPLELSSGLRFVLASSGGPGATAEAVARVRALRQQRPERFAQLCAQAEHVATGGLRAFCAGAVAELGRQLDANHALLQQLDVSTPALDRLIAAARAAGAAGAKLTGAGCGGFVVALATAAAGPAVCAALRAAGAAQTFTFAAGEQPGRAEEQPQ